MGVGDWIALGGLAIALYQINKAERAALAAKKAVESTSAQVNVYTLLLLIPELALVERELDRAATDDRVEETRRLLRNWQERAADLRGLLEQQSVNVIGLDTKVQKSLTLATKALGIIAKGEVKPEQATVRTRAAASELVLLARSEGARIRAAIPMPEHVPTLGEDLMATLRRLLPKKGV